MSNWQERVERARWWLIQQQPFYGALAMRLRDVEAPPHVPTAATDGVRILWRPEFVDRLSDAEIRFCVMHETMHCAHQHFWRLPMNAKANIAEDHVINLILLELADGNPAIALPKGVLVDPKYKGLSEEEVYALLPDNAGGGGYADGCGGIIEPDESAQGMSKEALKEAWTQAIIQAAMAAKAAQGHIPGTMERIIAAATVQRIDWRREMAEFVRDAVSLRKDWARSARRHATSKVIHPRRHADEVGLVVFARDTSGSVSNEMLGVYNTAIEAAMADSNCRGLVMDCDCRLQAEYMLAPGEPPPAHAKGGGGTDFKPVFERLEELDEPIAGIVYMTDLHGDFPESSDTPTLWLVCGDKSDAPFGRVVNIGD